MNCRSLIWTYAQWCYRISSIWQIQMLCFFLFHIIQHFLVLLSFNRLNLGVNSLIPIRFVEQSLAIEVRHDAWILLLALTSREHAWKTPTKWGENSFWLLVFRVWNWSSRIELCRTWDKRMFHGDKLGLRRIWWHFYITQTLIFILRCEDIRLRLVPDSQLKYQVWPQKLRKYYDHFTYVQKQITHDLVVFIKFVVKVLIGYFKVDKWAKQDEKFKNHYKFYGSASYTMVYFSVINYIYLEKLKDDHQK